jgi:hypothetical protein
MRKNNDKKEDYHGGRIKRLVEEVASIVSASPHLGLQEGYGILHAILRNSGKTDNENLAGYGERDHCFNCSRSMKIDEYSLGALHVLLLNSMAKQVEKEIKSGIPFTKANRVKIDDLCLSVSTKKQNSILGYLGLITQTANCSSGYWTITSWGWKALGGEPVSRSVKVWNKRIVERSQDMCTLSEAKRVHCDKIQASIARGKKIKSADHRSSLALYDPIHWVEFAGTVNNLTLFDN